MEILQREKLTKKAREAIQVYAVAKCKGMPIARFLVDFTLEAERTRREDLYSWLEKHGYRWNGYVWFKPAKQDRGA